jgi:hypothetical protein
MAKKTYNQEDLPPKVEEPPLVYTGTSVSNISSSGLNAAQLHLLKMLSVVKSEESFQDLKKILNEFLIQQIEKEANKYWDEGTINYDLLDEHLRTPYK